MTHAVIVSTARTPLAKSWKGAFNMTHGATLGGHAVKAAVERAGIDPAEVEDVLMGCANPEGATGSNIARQIALRAGCRSRVGGVTVNRFCSSGPADHRDGGAAHHRRRGRRLRRRRRGEHLLRAAGDEQAHARRRRGCSEHKPAIYWTMLQTAEQVAKRYNIPRERMDEYGARSQQKALRRAGGRQVRGRDRADHRRSPAWPTRQLGLRTKEVTVERRRRHARRHHLRRHQGHQAGVARRRDRRRQRQPVQRRRRRLRGDEREAMPSSSSLKPLGRFLGFAVAGCEPDEMGIGPVFAVPEGAASASA